MRKWILMALAVLLLIVVLPLAVGSVLPEAHVATSSVTLRQPIDSVWRAVRDFGAYAEWWDMVETMERRGAGGPETWVQRDRHGQAIPYEVVRSEPPRLLVTRIVDDGLPFGGTWTYRLERNPEGSTVSVTEDGRIYNPIFRVVSRFFLGYHGTLDRFLTALGARFGENVTPAHVD